VGNKFYTPGEERARKVHELFSAIAHRYDLINDLQSFGLHRYWKQRMLRLAGLKPGVRALDICCGTGDIALAMADRGADTIGLDFSDRMLAEAWKKRRPAIGETSLSIAFIQGDAMRLPFPDNQFNVVTIGYGLRNLADFRAGLREMWRVLKPGGRLLVLDFGKPDNALWRACYFNYLRWVVPLFGRIFCGDPQTYAYILESLRNYPAHHGVVAVLKELSCENIQTIHFLGGVMTINCGVK
jgi:demethylmenaquinone methyltransferase/2-methoxy-6-polyprenyl-1,4-benzoquinol methylase